MRPSRKAGHGLANPHSRSSSTPPKEEDDANASTPTTPTLGPSQDGLDLKRSASGRSIPALAQTSAVTVAAERALSSSPKSASISLGEAAKNSKSPAGSGADGETVSPEATAAEPKPTEDLPTPPDTPGPSTTDAATARDDEAGSEAQPQESTGGAEVSEVENKSYHEDADLHITVRDVNGGDAIYSVRSCVLESASHVWKHGIPSRTGDSIDMVSDPAFGLDVIFSIAHYKFQDLPRNVDAGQLYKIAVAAEKYDTIHLLLPFVKGWLASLGESDQTPGSQIDAIGSLVTGWILGDVKSFSGVISDCAYNSSIGPDGTLLDSQGKPWQDHPLAREVIEHLAAARLSAIEHIIQAMTTPVTTLLNPQSSSGDVVRFCQAPGDDSVREECEQLQLGSAIMGLTKAKLWPAPDASRVEASPAELARAYENVRLRRSVEDAHAQCGFGHKDQFGRILSQPVQLTPAIIEQLLSRAKKCGVYEEAAFRSLEEDLAEKPANPAE